MLNESVLREKAPFIGAKCAICERTVTKDEMEFEVEFAHDGDNPGFDTLTCTSGASRRRSSSGTSGPSDSRVPRRGSEARTSCPVVWAQALCSDGHFLNTSGKGPAVYRMRKFD
jgi:hypothetical protein